MTTVQLLSIGIITLMMAAFVWGRMRYDLIAACALLLSMAVGIVPLDEAFAGFSDDIVIIVGSALLVSAAVARSGIIEMLLQRFAPALTTFRAPLSAGRVPDGCGHRRWQRLLTPIGHQCNTLVMGPGGYKFGDYARLGLPLSILVVFTATPLLMAVWPL